MKITSNTIQYIGCERVGKRFTPNQGIQIVEVETDGGNESINLSRVAGSRAFTRVKRIICR